MAKKKTKVYKNVDISELNISTQINENFRNYALYVLEQRGIPNFYDGLTTVQRIILSNMSSKFTKSISCLGECILKGNYHHGDMSLYKAMVRLAKEYNCSENILIGDGFFGTAIEQQPAASRYTSIKYTPLVYDIIKENIFLNVKNEEGHYERFHINMPIGLMLHIMGIAVGYSTNILPRKYEDIVEYLCGNDNELKPFFKNYNGNVESKIINDKIYWLFSSVLDVNESGKRINILDLPPMIKYTNFLNKLNNYIDDNNINVEIYNNSLTNCNISIKFKDDIYSWENFKFNIFKFTKILVSENIVLIKDKNIIEYTKISDYLDDFKIIIEDIKLKKLEYLYNEDVREVSFLRAKLLFLNFMINNKRSKKEIETFIEKFEKNIKIRLSNVKLIDVSIETIKLTEEEIAKIDNTILQFLKDIENQKNIYEKKINLWVSKSTIIKNKKRNDNDVTFDDIDVFEVEKDEEVI